MCLRVPQNQAIVQIIFCLLGCAPLHTVGRCKLSRPSSFPRPAVSLDRDLLQGVSACPAGNRRIPRPRGKSAGWRKRGRSPAALVRAARSSTRTMSVAPELIRGADLETTGRKHGVAAAVLSPVARGLPGGRRRGPQDPAGGSGRRTGPPREASPRWAGDGEWAAAGTHSLRGGREAFVVVEGEAISCAGSASTGRCFGHLSGAQTWCLP